MFQKKFAISDYMGKQTGLNTAMRALLVDWMVEVQENFELNHETLYLAVKIVDLYLSKVIVNKESLQLLGCASLFIACKYDVSFK
jgi:cyclin B